MIASTKVMEEEAAALAKKIEKLKKGGELEKAERMVTETTHALNNAAKTLETQLSSIINAELSKQGKRDKGLRNARIVLTFKAGRIVVTLGASVAKLVGSGGADISGWISLTKELKAAGQLIYQQTKNEKKLRDDLHKAYKKFIASVEGTTSPAESSLKTYRNHSTKTKNNILSTSKKADKLQGEIRTVAWTGS